VETAVVAMVGAKVERKEVMAVRVARVVAAAAEKGGPGESHAYVYESVQHLE
tara:strand:+ start:495 stop:650 length:156 start_codon:yes stop_codon:yes gene_type:complete